MAFDNGFVVILASITCSLLVDSGVAALCSSPYCPPPWRAFQGHCYLWVDKPMPWIDAERYCQMLSHPGKMVHLASIHSQEEDEFIKDYVKSASDVWTPSYWIGFTDIEGKNRFQWSDGSASSYLGWGPLEPSSPGYEDCVECRDDFSHQWNDLLCSESIRFVCKL
ncbi:snaclec CHH-B subunit beta-like [Patiria miniata]|uniref:C-type lectin domain-containing protein n=1 Tax=Patiria miniata TaxID=46514 RepID=A0A914A6N6_PATMI|nr:snaclec CHH-B subunit beta-like [Patiria miniata]